MKKHHPRWLHNVHLTLYGILAIFAVVTFACLQSIWQPNGYRTSPVVCPPRESDTRGYCFVYRGDDYMGLHHPIGQLPMLMHISRAPASGGRDTTTIVGFSHGKSFTMKHSTYDPYPPQNSTEKFVQSIRDRRTELYSDMGWPDPNPPAIPPLNH
jgi:hypothetical protein